MLLIYIVILIEIVNKPKEIKSQDDALEKARIYAREGIWLDTLNNVASIQDSQLREREWRELLKSAGLQDFIDKPLIELRYQQLINSNEETVSP